MKFLKPKIVIRYLTIAFTLVFALMLVSPIVYSAGRGDKADQAERFNNVVEGPFHGLNLEEKRIWIDDMVYLLDSKVKVKGTAKKVGLITDLKNGESVRATLRENEKTPSIPYVILIERK